MKLQEFKIKQVINGKLYSYNRFTTTIDVYENLKKLLVLPKKNEIVTYKIKTFRVIGLYDKQGLKTYLYNLVFNLDVSSEDVFNVFLGKTFNTLNVSKVGVYNEFYFYPKNLIKQGRNFEDKVANYLENYLPKVIRNYLKNELDEGIDIIGIKGETLYLVQCKDWEVPIVTDKEIKEFLGNCYLFLYNHIEYRKFKKVRKLYIISDRTDIDISAKKLIEKNKDFVEIIQIPSKKEIIQKSLFIP